MGLTQELYRKLGADEMELRKGIAFRQAREGNRVEFNGAVLGLSEEELRDFVAASSRAAEWGRRQLAQRHLNRLRLVRRMMGKKA